MGQDRNLPQNRTLDTSEATRQDPQVDKYSFPTDEFATSRYVTLCSERGCRCLLAGCGIRRRDDLVSTGSGQKDQPERPVRLKRSGHSRTSRVQVVLRALSGYAPLERAER